jgi:hypothetical protein
MSRLGAFSADFFGVIGGPFATAKNSLNSTAGLLNGPVAAKFFLASGAPIPKADSTSQKNSVDNDTCSFVYILDTQIRLASAARGLLKTGILFAVKADYC